jgi:hypothetical protein
MAPEVIRSPARTRIRNCTEVLLNRLRLMGSGLDGCIVPARNADNTRRRDAPRRTWKRLISTTCRTAHLSDCMDDQTTGYFTTSIFLVRMDSPALSR